jgi:hypothetical protein
MMFNAYLRWEIKIPFVEAETSIPRKYLIVPRSLRWKSLCKKVLVAIMLMRSFPVIRMSSTYIKRDVKDLPCCLVNREWSA